MSSIDLFAVAMPCLPVVAIQLQNPAYPIYPYSQGANWVDFRFVPGACVQPDFRSGRACASRSSRLVGTPGGRDAEPRRHLGSRAAAFASCDISRLLGFPRFRAKYFDSPRRTGDAAACACGKQLRRRKLGIGTLGHGGVVVMQ